jgi:hypothetical protein
MDEVINFSSSVKKWRMTLYLRKVAYIRSPCRYSYETIPQAKPPPTTNLKPEKRPIFLGIGEFASRALSNLFDYASGGFQWETVDLLPAIVGFPVSGYQYVYDKEYQLRGDPCDGLID